MLTIGVLALQGAFAEHIAVLRRLGVTAREVRLPKDLEGLDGLIIPGGESTTIGKLLVTYGLLDELRQRAERDFPLYGTCAGMILLAKQLSEGVQPLIGMADITVKRNAFGRQVDSFEQDIPMPAIADTPIHAVFIRAPFIERTGDGVEVLGKLSDGTVVAARQGNILVSAFHPELSNDTRFHEYFLKMVREQKKRSARNSDRVPIQGSELLQKRGVHDTLYSPH